MYFLKKNGDIPASYVSLPEGSKGRIAGISFHCHVSFAGFNWGFSVNLTDNNLGVCNPSVCHEV